jgi:tetratricopeptide (TPR) repeat protein
MKPQKAVLKSALDEFLRGNFKESENIFRQILTESPEDTKSLFYSGYISFLQNQLDSAEILLKKALQSSPKSAAIKSILANVYYRKSDFTNASVLFNSLGRKFHAAKLNSLKDKKAYHVSSKTNSAEIVFIKTDPLPVIRMSINGADPVNFLIDTGAGEVIIDNEYAKTLSLKTFGAEKSLFGGGKVSSIEHSCIDSLKTDGLEINNLPVILLDLKAIGTDLYGGTFRINGIIGTLFFYQFLTSLDYKNERIRFEIPGEQTNSVLESLLKNNSFTEIPISMADDHYILAKGRLNHSDEMLFFVDSGLGGCAFTAPASTIKSYNLKLKKEKAGFGLGGGGKMKTIPFDIDALSLGEITENNLSGLFGPFPSFLENSFGFKISGLISHEFFRKHTVIFDFSKMRMLISR